MTPSNKNLKIITAIIFVIVVISVGFFVFIKMNQETSDSANNHDLGDVAAPSEDLPIKVEAAPARIGDLVMRLSATGLTRALREVTISPKVSSQVMQLPIEEGEFVNEGELLMKLDDRELVLSLADAKDKLVGAQAEFSLRWHTDTLSVEHRAERVGEFDNTKQHNRNTNFTGLIDLEQAKSLWVEASRKFARGELSEEAYLKATLEYETARVISGNKREELIAHKTGLTQAALAVQRAELNLSYTEIRAPFSGFLANLEVEKGQQAATGKECLKLVDLSKIEVEIQVLESEIGLVQKGRQAEISFPAYPGESFHGRVVHINPMVNHETKTAKVTVLLDNPDQRILPGMFAYAKLEAQIFKDRFLVPKDAIIIRDQRQLVFVVRDGLAKWCYVDTGLENEDFVEILDSRFELKPGEMVITSGHYTLVHDALVRY